MTLACPKTNVHHRGTIMSDTNNQLFTPNPHALIERQAKRIKELESIVKLLHKQSNKANKLSKTEFINLKNQAEFVRLHKTLPIRRPNQKNGEALSNFLKRGYINIANAKTLIDIDAVINMPDGLYNVLVLNTDESKEKYIRLVAYNRYSYEVLHHASIPMVFTKEGYRCTTYSVKDLKHEQFSYLLEYLTRNE